MTRLHFKHWPRHLPLHLSYPATGFTEHLETNARRYPNKVAVDFYGRTFTYRELYERVERLAGHLRHRAGVEPGDRVLLDMQNSLAYIVGFYAVLRADAVAVPVNPMNRSEELAWYLEDTGAKVALVGSELLEHFLPLRRDGAPAHLIVARYADDLPAEADLPVPDALLAAPEARDHDGVVSLRTALEHPPLAEPAQRCGEQLAALLYTSGTTAHPKGCMLSHRALNAQLVTQANCNPWSNEARVLSVVPFFHVTGMIAAMGLPLFLGGTLHLMSRWDRLCAVQAIHRHRITHWCNIPTMVVDLLALPDVEQYDFSSLVCVYGGGTSMPLAVAERFFALTGLEYQEGWGMTEMVAGVHLNPYGRSKRQCLGVPMFEVDTRVLDPDTGGELGIGEKGELISRGPCMFSGYWNNPQATREAFVEFDGQRFFRTGDIGYYDEEGYFFMADRLKRMVNVSGYKVWPSEVENILYRHPAIQEACVIACNRNDRGETVKALVALRPGATLAAEELMDWAREHMAAYKIPRAVEFVDELPKTGSGKIQWRLLQEQENNK
ncbi:long-chain-fatty-acid--CoA ligase [Azotobacter vinelandii]